MADPEKAVEKDIAEEEEDGGNNIIHIKMADPEKAVEKDIADEDVEEYEEEEDGGNKKITSQLLRNPQVLAALQGRLGSMVGTPSGYIQSLPAPVKRRIKALKKLQLETTKIETEFYKELHVLECKYHFQYIPFYEKRKTILGGEYEPNDEECEWPSDDEDNELSKDLKEKAKLEDEKGEIKEKAKLEEEKSETKESETPKMDEDAKGIPEFWLTVFKNVEMLAEMVMEHDEPILRNLTDIKLQMHNENPMGFTLEFHFAPNDFFTNAVLTKNYEMKCSPDESDPFSFEGPEIYKCKGCTIDWKKNKNVTVKVVKKKQKHKARGAMRTITKTVQNDSFFNFFNPPHVPEDPNAEVDEDTQSLLTADFEIGHYFRERIIPRAVLYFTGEALEEDEFEEEGDGEDTDEEDEDDDPDFDPKKGNEEDIAKGCPQQ